MSPKVFMETIKSNYATRNEAKVTPDKEIKINDIGPQGHNDCAFFVLAKICEILSFKCPPKNNKAEWRNFFLNIAEEIINKAEIDLQPIKQNTNMYTSTNQNTQNKQVPKTNKNISKKEIEKLTKSLQR